MAKPFKNLTDKMSPESQAWAKAESKRLLAEMPLHDLRRALDLTQEQLATDLDIKQASLSKIERQTDMLLSTLGRYLNAMNVQLELKAIFPDGHEVIITQLENIEENRVST